MPLALEAQKSQCDRDLNPGSLAESVSLIYYPTLTLGIILSESPISTKGEFRAVLRGLQVQPMPRAEQAAGQGVRIQSFWSLIWNSLLCFTQQVQGGLVYPRPPPIPASLFSIPICSIFHSSSQGPFATPHQFLPQDLPGMGHHISIHGSWTGKRHSNPFAFKW